MQMYSCSPTLSQTSLKNSFGKVVFQILAKIEIGRKIKIGYLVAILRRYNILIFCRIVISYSPCIYGANFIAKFLWESGFQKGVPWNPLGHQRE